MRTWSEAGLEKLSPGLTWSVCITTGTALTSIEMLVSVQNERENSMIQILLEVRYCNIYLLLSTGSKE